MLSAIGFAIGLEAKASPPGRASSSHPADTKLRGLALAASLVLLAATLYATLHTRGAIRPLAAAAFVIGGGWLRAAAMRNLGSQFRTEAGAERLVTTGIHAVMRHPSELGLLCWALGLFVAAPSLMAAVLAALQLPLLVARLRIEEAALAEQFPKQWRQFATQTRRFGV